MTTISGSFRKNRCEFLPLIAFGLVCAFGGSEVKAQRQGSFETLPPALQFTDQTMSDQVAPWHDDDFGEYDAVGFDLPGDQPQLNYAQPGYFQSGCDRSFSAQSVVQIDTCLSSGMLDFQNRQTDKQLFLLDHGKWNSGNGPQLIVGGQFRASVIAASTNRDSKFPYLGRFPTDFVGKNATDARMLHANIAAAAHFSPWAHGYIETLFSDVFSFPGANQGSFQVRQAYITLGNFNVSPFYMFIGKKTVGFGDMSTLSPFSQALNWHYFAALHEGIGAGYFRNGINFNVTALNGGRGIRVADSSSIGHLNNLAANLSVSRQIQPGVVVQLGGGYLHGTIYDAARAEHTDTTLFGTRNPAWDANAQVRVGNLNLAAEITRTYNPWLATGSHVTAWRGEVGIDSYLFGKPSTLTASWGEGIQGPSGSQFEFNRQLVIGSSVRFSPNALFTLEYVHSAGFAPLINITTVSDRDVHQHSAVFGVVLSL